MSPSLLSRGFIERIKLFSVLNTTMSQYDAPQTSREACAEAVKVLEAKVKEKPKEWIFWYALGDWYSALGEYAKAVRACETCYELRPRDPRSAYGLATTLRMLTRVKYLDHPKAKDIQEFMAEIQEFMAESGLSGYDEFDPLKSQHGLDELGLTIDQAAERSLALFEEVITLGVNDSDAKMVKNHLAAMYSEFPHLETKVKSSRKPSTGLFPQNLENIKLKLRCFMEAYESLHIRSLQVDFMNCDLETAQRTFIMWKAAITQQRRQIIDISEMWPEGTSFFKPLIEYTDIWMSFIDNAARWREFVFSLNNYNTQEIFKKQKKFVLRNRKLAARLDKLFISANEYLKSITGLDMYNYLSQESYTDIQ